LAAIADRSELGAMPEEVVDELGARMDAPFLHVDLWVGDDGLVRRETTSTDGDVLLGDDDGMGTFFLASMLTSSSFVEYFDYGADVGLSEPTDYRDITAALVSARDSTSGP
jgi:hypothetical protein